ncbi:aromatic-ring hydroxylase C-terminal domain-containing protein [Vibrio cholerae]|uniref:aromatic-ring hydroxylase C-terminal domain-containing protein n=1 Tax=Vibrio cholerae TaxID=666 RepID=UPI00387DCD4D
MTAVLIRPDGYIAWASNEQDATRLRSAMRHALTPFQTASHALETTERLADE